MAAGDQRIAKIVLDERTVVRRNENVEHERAEAHHEAHEHAESVGRKR